MIECRELSARQRAATDALKRLWSERFIHHNAVDGDDHRLHLAFLGSWDFALHSVCAIRIAVNRSVSLHFRFHAIDEQLNLDRVSRTDAPSLHSVIRDDFELGLKAREVVSVEIECARCAGAASHVDEERKNAVCNPDAVEQRGERGVQLLGARARSRVVNKHLRNKANGRNKISRKAQRVQAASQPQALLSKHVRVESVQRAV